MLNKTKENLKQHLKSVNGSFTGQQIVILSDQLCKFHWTKIVILSNQLCKMSCFAELMNERCGCVWYSISYDPTIPVCDIENMTVGKPLCTYMDWFNYASILKILCSDVCVLRCIPRFGVLALCKREYIRIRKWIPQAWPSFYENYLKFFLVSISHAAWYEQFTLCSKVWLLTLTLLKQVQNGSSQILFDTYK